jgi:hypothetical protein
MKLTATQLRRIIAEEVKRVTLKEDYVTVPTELQTMLDAVCDGWKSQFDPKDPSMDASGGKQVWEAQCEAACEVLGEKIEELMMQVEEDLHLGQFYKG